MKYGLWLTVTLQDSFCFFSHFSKASCSKAICEETSLWTRRTTPRTSSSSRALPGARLLKLRRVRKDNLRTVPFIYGIWRRENNVSQKECVKSDMIQLEWCRLITLICCWRHKVKCNRYFVCCFGERWFFKSASLNLLSSQVTNIII